MRATTSEKKTAIAAVQPNWTKNLPGTPDMNAVGRKTAMRVNEVAITARPISSAASCAASSGVLPMRRWRMMFSISTIASSTRMPMTSDSESSVTTLMEKPIRSMTQKAGITDSGSAVAETSVARQSRRNSQTTSTAGAARADDLEADHRLAVEQGAAALLGDGVADPRHLVEADVPAVRQRHLEP